MADWDLNAFEVIFYTFGGFIVFFAPVLGFVALFFLVVASLLWSPFAAAICGRIARKMVYIRNRINTVGRALFAPAVFSGRGCTWFRECAANRWTLGW